MTGEGIRARLAAATPGPWGSVEDTYRSVPMLRIGSHSNGADVAQVILHAAQDKADAEFIANAPTDIAKLLDALDMAESVAQRLDAMGSHQNEYWARELRAAINGALGDDTNG